MHSALIYVRTPLMHMHLYVCMYMYVYIQALEGAYFLHEKGVGEETQVSYRLLAQSLDEFIGKEFNEWAGGVERELQKYLEVPLMTKITSKNVYVYTEKLLQSVYTCVGKSWLLYVYDLYFTNPFCKA